MEETALTAALAGLPHGPEFRFIDRLTALVPGKSGAGEYRVRGDEPFLKGHFPDQPLMPGVLLVEAAAQLAGVVAQCDPAHVPLSGLKLTALRAVKILGSARPGQDRSTGSQGRRTDGESNPSLGHGARRRNAGAASFSHDEWRTQHRYSMSRHTKECQAFVQNHLGRPWRPADGLLQQQIDKAEARLGITLPSALRSFHLTVGAVDDLCSIHNYVFHPKDLDLDEGYLIFAEENQRVVSWGMRKRDLRKANPVVWQRNNSSDDWYSEEKGLVEFLTSMFDWYQQLGVWSVGNNDH